VDDRVHTPAAGNQERLWLLGERTYDWRECRAQVVQSPRFFQCLPRAAFVMAMIVT
jgi:hypothetical protein